MTRASEHKADHAQRIPLLRAVSLFSSLNEDQLEALSAQCRRRQFTKNTLLFMEGDNSDQLFIVESGTVKIFASDEEGNQVTLNYLSQGDYFGELALLDSGPRSASAQTINNTVVLCLSQQAFTDLLSDNPALSQAVIRKLAGQVRELTATVKDQALLDVYGRVVKVLENQEDYASGRRLTHAEIANIVGSSREMVSRIIKELSLGAYIEQLPDRFVVQRKLPKRW